MRLLASPEFSGKLTALTAADIQRVSQFVDRVKNSNKEALTVDAEVVFLESNVYVAKLGETRVYFTIDSDPDGEYVLLLDASVEHGRAFSGALFAAKDPKMNAALNPRLNTQLNPAWNQSLNPAWNHNINPAWNHNINPAWNHSINPAWNHSINPAWNRAFGGPFIYSQALGKEAYLVRASSEVEILFSLNGAHIGQLVKATDQVRLQFDAKIQWIGFAVRANDDVALLFSSGGKWEGQIIV